MDSWRRIRPADCVGLPVIMSRYVDELTDLANGLGIEVRAGTTLMARYERRDDEWFPIPESIRVGHYAYP